MLNKPCKAVLYVNYVTRLCRDALVTAYADGDVILLYGDVFNLSCYGACVRGIDSFKAITPSEEYESHYKSDGNVWNGCLQYGFKDESAVSNVGGTALIVEDAQVKIASSVKLLCSFCAKIYEYGC